MENKELPAECKFENFIWGMSIVWNVLFIPFFIYNITKGNRSNKWIVNVVKLSYFNPMDKGSAATIERNALWQYGIPTHNMSMFWKYEEDILGIETEFLVPETQAFIADVYLRQWANELEFIVTSKPIVRNGIPSTRYSNSLYKPKPYMVKNKSMDMVVGNTLFGGSLKKFKGNYRNSKLGKTYD